MELLRIEKITNCRETLNGLLAAAMITFSVCKDNLRLELYQWWLSKLFEVVELYGISPAEIRLPDYINNLTEGFHKEDSKTRIGG